MRRVTTAAIITVALLVAACSPPRATPGSPGPPGEPARRDQPPGEVARPVTFPAERDFTIVAYQGEAALGGAQARFSQVFDHGKPVVLNFWAGQCPPCRAEMPEFQRVANEFEGRVIFVGADVGVFTGLGNHDNALRLLQDLGIRYPTGYAVDATPLQIYGVRQMPTTVFLSASGEVIRTVGGIMTESQLRAQLAGMVRS